MIANVKAKRKSGLQGLTEQSILNVAQHSDIKSVQHVSRDEMHAAIHMFLRPLIHDMLELPRCEQHQTSAYLSLRRPASRPRQQCPSSVWDIWDS